MKKINKNIEENFDFFNVSEEVRNNVNSCVKENGYKLLNVMKSSNHKDDNFLYIVLANKEDALSGHEYVCWKYNGRGLNNGGYHSTFKAAMFDMVHRIYDLEHIKLSDRMYSQLENQDLNSMDNFLGNEYQIIRHIDDLPTKISLTKEEVNDLVNLNKAVTGYEELNYCKEEFNKNDQEKIENMMKEKSLCLDIQNAIEDIIATEVDLNLIKTSVIQQFVKVYEIQHDPLEHVIESATKVSTTINNQDNQEKDFDPKIKS